jgi:septal ring factor EnvC (AmiA/AmiB activator)
MCRRPLSLMFVLAAFSAHADTLYKCTDTDGHTTYTNQKSSTKNCRVLVQDQPVSTFAAPKARANTPTPSGFPRVTSDEQKSRDSDRRKIIQDELSTERDKLNEAKKDLSDQEAQRLGGEKNYQKYVDRVKPFQDEVDLHQRNVDSLEKELGNLH